MEFKDAHNQNIDVTGYPTEKNLDMLRRIVRASSNEGDLVMDCFMGSGTTLVAAEENSRRWIGMDSSVKAVETTLKRLANGSEPMGDYVKGSNGRKVRSHSLFPTGILARGSTFMSVRVACLDGRAGPRSRSGPAGLAAIQCAPLSEPIPEPQTADQRPCIYSKTPFSNANS